VTTLSYNQTVQKSLPAFTIGRFIPTAGISIVFLLIAHKSPDALPVFSYVLAVATVVSAFSSLMLATVGNKAASLGHDIAARRDLFTGGFTLALCSAILTPAACLVAAYFARETSGAQFREENLFWNLSLIYISSTPLLVINTFLQLFLEATGKASRYSRTKTWVTCVCAATLTLSASFTTSNTFTLQAMSYFFITELLTLIILIRLVSDQNFCSFVQAKNFGSSLLSTGLPIAAGLCGQKVFYYLLMERVARVDSTLVAQLTVFMSVIGLLVIPMLALCQIHSLQVSERPSRSASFYWRGLAWASGMLGLNAVVLYLAGEEVFQAIGGSVLPYDGTLYLLTVCFLGGSTLISFALAHLRARNETLAPQIFINVVMLLVFIPLIYSITFTSPTVKTFLFLQAAMAWICFLLLCIRIFIIHRFDTTRAQAFS
jgi:hypothetical protein